MMLPSQVDKLKWISFEIKILLKNNQVSHNMTEETMCLKLSPEVLKITDWLMSVALIKYLKQIKLNKKVTELKFATLTK